MNVEKLCLNENERIPIIFRSDKNEAKKLIDEIKLKQYKINNADIFVLADWIGEKLLNYDNNDEYSIVENIEKYGHSDTYDLSIDDGNSYTANGIICHNTLNLPENITIDEVKKIYETAWKSGCKGVTIYRQNSRTGVLLDNNQKKVDTLTKTTAPKRPKEVIAEVHHFKISGENYYVTVGLLNNEPYEIFVGKNTEDINIPKEIKSGKIRKIHRGDYELITDENQYKLNGEYLHDTTEALTRMISTSLRHGVDISFIVQQLEKTKGDLYSFSKALSRALKKYIKDGEKVTGDNCPQCQSNDLIREDGCVKCAQCSWTRC